MIKVGYNNLSETIRLGLESAVMGDPYSLRPETLYNNIVGSLYGARGSDLERIRSVSDIMEVNTYIVSLIFEANFEMVD